jgi:hypothetical protein
MDTTNSPCSGDQHIQTKVIQQFADAAYIALRPTFEYGDHTVMACFREAEEFRIDYGPAHGPSHTMETYADAHEAIKTMKAIKAAYPHLRIWYDGQEDQTEITDDVWLGLAEAWGLMCEWWEVVEMVADGSLTPDDQDVLKAIDEVPLIAAAVAHVTP